MSHVLFGYFFPEIAARETRCIILPDRRTDGLPAGHYAFLELYCEKGDCDCRNVYIWVAHPKYKDPFATICYGWKSLDFYRKWMYAEDINDRVREFKGPSLPAFYAHQTEYSPFWLNIFKNMIKTDKDYIRRLERHYNMFKKNVREKKGSH